MSACIKNDLQVLKFARVTAVCAKEEHLVSKADNVYSFYYGYAVSLLTNETIYFRSTTQQNMYIGPVVFPASCTPPKAGDLVVGQTVVSAYEKDGRRVGSITYKNWCLDVNGKMRALCDHLAARRVRNIRKTYEALRLPREKGRDDAFAMIMVLSKDSDLRENHPINKHGYEKGEYNLSRERSLFLYLCAMFARDASILERIEDPSALPFGGQNTNMHSDQMYMRQDNGDFCPCTVIATDADTCTVLKEGEQHQCKADAVHTKASMMMINTFDMYLKETA
jgi:hypothetical protein